MTEALERVSISLGGAYCNLGIVHRVNHDLPASLDALVKSLAALQPLLAGAGKYNNTAKRYAVNAGWNKARTLCVRAADEPAEARANTIAECLSLLRECQEIIPGSLKGFLGSMTAYPDFAPLRESEAGAAFLKTLSEK